MLPAAVNDLAREAVARPGRIVVLTGAGVSAASGIPTFRGPEGYWTVGSQVYTPAELATRAAFADDPDRIWAWYLFRLGVCRSADPNPAHDAIARLERGLEDRFLLITQNVDGLHLRAGNTPGRTYAVHGSIEHMRCAAECTATLLATPGSFGERERGAPLTDADRALLRCPSCGAWTRPHVLWFDETYDEPRYRFESSLRAAGDAALLLTVGTSGATTLPALVAETAASAGATLVDVNPEANPFATLARRSGGAAVNAPATDAVPALADTVLAVG